MASTADDPYETRLGPLISTEPAPSPSKQTTILGRYVDLIPMSAQHGDDLFPLIGLKEHERLWDYMLEFPFQGDRDRFESHIQHSIQRPDMVFFTIRDKTVSPHRVAGYIGYLRINPTERIIEIGCVMMSHLLQRTKQATETVYHMIRHAFEQLGYRRVEWKCNNLNEPSKRAAQRFGFIYEGLFRQGMIVKGRSRDTAWFSMIDKEWPQRKAAFEAWLDPDNFDTLGNQKKRLNEFQS